MNLLDWMCVAEYFFLHRISLVEMWTKTSRQRWRGMCHFQSTAPDSVKDGTVFISSHLVVLAALGQLPDLRETKIGAVDLMLCLRGWHAWFKVGFCLCNAVHSQFARRFTINFGGGKRRVAVCAQV